MREWGLSPTLRAPEPNTWREVLAVLDDTGSLSGKRIAIQEYGEPSTRLAAGLRERGAEVMSVSIYAWGLPEDLGPLTEAIRAIADGQTDGVTFTSAQQVRNVLQVAGDLGLEQRLRDGLKQTVIGSIGPTCSEALRDAGLGFDFEPDRPKMGDLVRGLARSADLFLRRKRSSLAAGVDTSCMRRVDVAWPAAEVAASAERLADSAFLRACRREPTLYTPVWIMRQAGRYQREYREIRAKVPFLEMCKRPEVAAEVTLMAVDRLGVDAAIIFADILLVVEPMGLGLSFHEGRGPVIDRPVRGAEDIDRLETFDPADALSYVCEAVRITRRALEPGVPLIGFAGAPFTVASYMIEGGSSRNFVHTKSLMYRDAGAWHALMERLTPLLGAYLNAQIAAGAQAVQLFDSWVGCLDEADYRTFVLPHSRAVIEAVTPGVPVIHFGAGSGTLLKAMREAGGDVIGLDWRAELASAWADLGHDVAVQGNLDPVVLFATPAEIQRRATAILDRAGGRPGHIFNLGHGVLPTTPMDHVLALVDAVHEYRSAGAGTA
jgi:uroporphyrinogen decarboxylase